MHNTPLLSSFPPVSKAEWASRIRSDLKGRAHLKDLLWHLPDGIDVAPFLMAEDLTPLPHVGLVDGTMPGTGALRTAIIQEVALDPGEAGRRQVRAALEQGADALLFRISSVPDIFPDQASFNAFFNGLPPGAGALYFSPSDGPGALVPLWLNAVEQGCIPADCTGGFRHDPFAALLREGSFPLTADLDHLARLYREVGPSWPHLLTLDGAVYDEAGATPALTLACILAAASDYVRHLDGHGLTPLEVATRMHVFLPVGPVFLAEVARCRALRILLPMLFAAYGEPECPPVPLWASPSRWYETAQDVYVNQLRHTTEVAAAIVGGCDAVCVHPFDERVRPPRASALRLARNTALILRHEAHLNAVRDPAAGSYHLEVLTDQMSRTAWGQFQEIEGLGGFTEVISTGWLQERIAACRERREADVAACRTVFVGMNKYPAPPDEESHEPAALERTPPYRAPMPYRTPKGTLSELRLRLRSGEPVADLTTPVPPGMTVTPLPVRPGSQPFDRLDERARRHAAVHGRRPRVLLLPFGPPIHRTRRAIFSVNFFGCGGFDVVTAPGVEVLEAHRAHLEEEQPDVIVFCSADAEYVRQVPAFLRAYPPRASRPLPIVAAPPGPDAGTLVDAGVVLFVHAGSPCHATLDDIQNRLGLS